MRLQHYDDQHGRLSERERDFVNQMAERVLWREPSERQARWLLGIFRRLGGKNSMTRHVLHRDVEGFGPLDLRVVGAHRWAADPRSGIYCVAYAVDDGPVQLWVPPDPVPPEWFEAANNTDWFVAAHNDAYEVRRSSSTSCILALRFPAHSARAPYLHASGCPGTWIAGEARPAGGRAGARQPQRRRRRKTDACRWRGRESAGRMKSAEGLLYFDDPERRARLGKYCCQDMEVERETL